QPGLQQLGGADPQGTQAGQCQTAFDLAKVRQKNMTKSCSLVWLHIYARNIGPNSKPAQSDPVRAGNSASKQIASACRRRIASASRCRVVSEARKCVLRKRVICSYQATRMSRPGSGPDQWA